MAAFLCTESEILDRAELAAYIPPVRDALVAAGGRPAVISSIGGKAVALVGEAPRNLVVSEWPNLAAAQAWLKSPELAALEPQRAKALPGDPAIHRRSAMKKAALLVALLPGLASAQQTSTMKLSIQVENRILNTNLIDSKTTRDFISLLPLTLTMNDLFGREKWGQLPRPISEDGTRVRSYDVGDVIYWSPSAHVAIFYRHDGQSIPAPGIIVMGKMESGVEALAVPGSVKVTIDLVK